MRSFSLIILVLFCTTPSFSRAAEAQPIDHFVFLIHGLGGNIESFGSMEKALTRHLNESGELGNVAVASFGYKTFRELNRSEEFAKDFSDFITTTTNGWGDEKYVASPNYTFSIVAHSQGGLVSAIMFYEAYQGAAHYNPEIPHRLKNVITLGTPFWGSKVASYAVQNPIKFKGFSAYADGSPLQGVGKVGKLQIKELALGSSVVQEFRQNMMNMTPELVEKIHEKLRVLNVAGNANLKKISSEDTTMVSDWSEWKKEKGNNLLKWLLRKSFGLVEYEADMLVSLPSSTLNTMAARIDNKGYKSGHTTTQDNFLHYNSADRLFVRTVHASPIAEEVHDIVYTPKMCLEDENCEHPTYKYVLNYLRGHSLSEMKESLADLRDGRDIGLVGDASLNETMAKDNVKLHNFGGFTIAVKANVPEDISFMKRGIRIDVEPNEKPLKPNQLRMAPELLIALEEEMVSKIRYDGSKTYPNSVLEWRTGHFKWHRNAARPMNDYYREHGRTVKIRVHGPGMKERIIIAPVKPTLSTFVEVDVELIEDEKERMKSIQSYIPKVPATSF